MSEEEAQVEESTAPSKKKVPLFAVLAVCALLGGAAGAFGVAPLVVGGDAEGEGTEEQEESRGGGHGGGHGSKSSGPLIYSIENIVLNPMGTNGTRFLMASAAFEVKDDRTLEQMRARDSEIRDILNRTFGRRTVDELADLEQRESIREDLRQAVESVVPAGSIRKVYLPQFVIQ